MPIDVRVEWKAGFVFANLKKKARDDLRAALPEFVEWTQQLTPVKTGRLRSTVDAAVAAQGVRVTVWAGGIAFDGHDVDYARFVHDGTDRMGARPFITWAMQDWAPEFKRIVARAWQSLG